jgi:uncharacterized repeat protein (TIGR01451 family)
VTVTGVDDALDDGDVGYTILTAPAVSTDPNYGGVNAADVSVTNTDNDTVGITVNPTSGLATTEAGGTAAFTIVLTSQPTADVTIGLSSSDTTEGTVSPASVTFTPLNWNVAQTVTVTGVDDALDDGDIAYTIVTAAAVSADPAYNGRDPADVTVTNIDDDAAAAIVVTPVSGLTTTEAGGTATFTVVLANLPTADVTVALSSSDTSEGTVGPVSLTFTPADWNVPQTVTVTGVDDLVVDGSVGYTIITAPASSADPAYDGMNPADVAVTNLDDDAAGIVVTPTSGLTTTEAGGTATFTVVLGSQPAGDVTIGLSSSDATEGTVDAASLTFTSVDWNVPQTVTVTGVDDPVIDGDIAYSVITAAAVSSDANYSGRNAADVSVTNLDDDTTPGNVILLTKRAGPSRVQPGQVASFTIELRNIGTTALSSVRVIDRPDAGLSYVEGSARLDGALLGGVTLTSSTVEFQVDALPAPVDSNSNGQIDPGEPGYRVITYAMRVGAGARPGIYGNLAVATEACDNCYVAEAVRAELEVRADPAFDLGTIIGKVFYDRNANGIQDTGEPGVAAAMVALDDGTYSLTDEFGRYHFPAVEHGQRLVKLNLASIAGNARAVGRVTRVLSVTPGLLVKANFGVGYDSESEAIGQPQLYGAELEAGWNPIADDVRGSTRMSTVVINGRETTLTSNDVRLTTRRMDNVVELSDESGPLALHFNVAAAASREPPLSWRFQVRDDGQAVVCEWQGVGEPPRALDWDGITADQQRIRAGEAYFYQMEVEYGGGVRVQSPLRIFGVNRLSTVMLELRGGAFRSGSAELTDAARQLLGQTAQAIRQYPDEKIVIAGHTDSQGDEQYNLGLSQRRAEAAFRYLTQEQGLPPERFSVVGYGEDRPIASNATAEGRELNRRVEIVGELKDVKRAQLYRRAEAQAQVKLNGTDVAVGEDGRFAAQAPAATMAADGGEYFSVEMADQDGHSVTASLRMPRIEVLGDAAGERLALPGVSGQDPVAVREFSGAMDYTLRGVTDPDVRLLLDGAPVATDAEGRFAIPLKVSLGDSRHVLTATNAAGFVRYGNVNLQVRTERDGEAVVVVPPIPALSVQLPPRGVPLTGARLVVPGVTAAGNRVTINGQPVEVGEDGRFLATLELQPGVNTLRAEVVDGDGNTGSIEREITVGESGLFMLALADGKITQLERSGTDRSSETVTEGRIALYLKGHVRGQYLLTAAFDTGTNEFDKLFSDLNARDNERLLTNIDPDTIYPVYGDSSELVYDAQSQGKLYLALTGDQLEALVGNYALSFSETELAAFQRTVYGAQVRFHSAAKTSEGASLTELQVAAADTDQQSVRDVINATGGSLYFLSHQDIIEGSEQIALLVYDQNTGLLLRREPQQRGIDYNIQYEQGRIYFNRPLQSVQSDGALIGPAPLSGNQVSLQIDYSTRDGGGTSSTYAGRVRQRVLDGKLAIGATVVDDSQGASQYQLGGVDAEFKTRGTRIVTEVARSEGTESSVFQSTDGGLTFSRRADGPVQQANAYKIAGEFDIGEWFGKSDRYLATAYYKSLDAGFAASQNFAASDTEQFGGSLNWILRPQDRLSLRFDTQSADGNRRSLSAVQWRHDAGKYTLVAEVQDRQTDSAAAVAPDDATYAAVRVSFNPADDLQLSLTHMEAIRGDEGRETGAEALWKITSAAGLRARAAFGDRGDAAELAATYDFPIGQVYLGRRLSDTDSSSSSSTVLGATMPIEGGGKAYTEYEWGALNGGPSVRSVVGVQRDWRRANGLSFLVAAERSASDTVLAGDERWALAAGVAYDNGAGLTLSSRNEWRRQQGAADLKQFVTVNAADWKFRDDLTLLGRLRIGDTEDELQPLRSLTFDEATLGLAYRPVKHDRLAALVRLTRRDESPTFAQVAPDRLASVSDVLSADWSYQFTPRLEWVGKQAVRWRTTDYGDDKLDSTTTLAIQRLNVCLPREFALGLEARRLDGEQSAESAQGWLTELGWEHFEHLRLGVGYNFTDFSDDLLRDRSYSERGFFLRIQGVY